MRYGVPRCAMLLCGAAMPRLVCSLGRAHDVHCYSALQRRYHITRQHRQPYAFAYIYHCHYVYDIF